LYIAPAQYVLAIVTGDHDPVGRSLTQALVHFQGPDHLSGVAYCLQILAVRETGRGAPREAARLWGMGEFIWALLGLPSTAHHRRSCAPYQESARGRLAEKGFEPAWATGRATPLDDVLYYPVE
jgi:hypothetical protein